MSPPWWVGGMSYIDVNRAVCMGAVFGDMSPVRHLALGHIVLSLPLDTGGFAAYRPVHAIRMVARSSYLSDLSSELL